MTAILARSALVLTTTPPFPREYGNRNRVFQTLQFLRNQGFSISLLLYPFDEEWTSTIPSYYRELVDQFEYFAVIPNSRTLHLAATGYHHTVDEWWDPSIGEHLAWLFKRRRFDVFFVNYTFLSKAFQFAPSNVMRILDTHDIFSGRREVFEQHGVGAEFFYTNTDEERVAFDRADLIIGIKASEAAFIRTVTEKPVTTLPYWADTPRPQRRVASQIQRRRIFSHDSPLRLGFIGAHNSVNIVNMRRFLHVLDRYIKLYNLPVVVVIAGNVCRQLRADYSFVTKLGRIPDIADFYQNIDVVVAPLEFSTGLKIKVAEALLWGVPVLATANAFDGFESFSSTQVEPSVASLCQTTASLATNEIAYSGLVLAARRAARAAARAQRHGLVDLQEQIRNGIRRILIITDRPFWGRATFMDELIAQAIEYVARIASTIVFSMRPEKIVSSAVHAEVHYVSASSEDDLAALLRETSARHRVKGALLFLEEAHLKAITATLTNVDVPSWIAAPTEQCTSSMVRLGASSRFQETLSVPPLRYAPPQCGIGLDAERITIFHSEHVSEWNECVLMYLEEYCRRFGLVVSRIQVACGAEEDSQFFYKTVQDRASKIVMLECEELGGRFVEQLARYRGARCLLITSAFACPQTLSATHSLPSLVDSIEAFVSGDGTAQVAAGPNAGWGRLWATLDQ